MDKRLQEELLELTFSLDNSRIINPLLERRASALISVLEESFDSGYEMYTWLHARFINALKKSNLGSSVDIDHKEKSLQRLCDIVCIGDSNTYMEDEKEIIPLRETYPFFLLNYLREDDNPHNILNLGLPGYTIRDYNQFLEETGIHRAFVREKRIIIISLGTNDLGIAIQMKNFDDVKSKIVHDMDALADFVRCNPASKIYCLPILYHNKDLLKAAGIQERKIIEINSALEETCQKNDIHYIPIKGFEQKHYQDFIHFNRLGGIRIAADVFNAIKPGLDDMRRYKMFRI